MKLDKISILVFASSVIALVLQCSLLGSWLIDDAGISMAYARNLAHHGKLIAQIGSPPVEAYSNPLWVFLLAYVQGLGSTVAVLKTLSLVLLIWAAWRLCFAFPPHTGERSVALASAVFLVLQPSVVIWGLSGLENPLYFAAGVELIIQLCKTASSGSSARGALIAGIAAGSLALTRPDGVVYIPLYMIVLLFAKKRSISWRSAFVRSFLFPSLCFAAYVAFRYTYFGSLVPNTYFAKGGPSLWSVVALALLTPDSIAPTLDVSGAIFGNHLAVWGLVLSVFVLVARWRDFQNGIVVGAGIFGLTALVTFLLLPQDWMPELRFATLVFPGAYLVGCAALYGALRPIWFSSLLSVLVVLSGLMCFARISEFRNRPPISIDEVKDRSDNIAHWGKLLGIERPSVLTADIGGALLRDQLEIVDLGMLADRQIAEALGEGSQHRDVARFRDYILERRKPVFMELRAYHSWIAHFDDDPRFRRDYVPIHEYRDGWIKQRRGEEAFSGDYVRRDAIGDKATAFAQMQAEAASFSYPYSKYE